MKAPIKNFIPKDYPTGNITQWFGLNYALYSNMCVPDINSPFLPAGQYCSQGHNGIDIVAPWRTELFAVEGGKVFDVRKDATGFGRHIRILTPTQQVNVFKEWVYGHMEDIYVEVGQELKEGELIGTMGNTGFVVSGATPFWKYNPFAGTHLHLGVRKRTVYPNGSQGSVFDYYNGFYGYYDFRNELPGATEEAVSEKELTIRSLENLASQYEQQGKTKEAGWIRSIISIVRAF